MATDLPTIAILRPGTFTDIHGTKVTFSAADVRDIAASYDAVSDPAPLVVGHPKIDAPAYGWVGGLTLQGDELVATPSQVNPAFAEIVRDGAYRKVSAKFYAPTSPANPKPGTYYLQHIGFLGAAAPAIKGLGTVSFSEDADAASITIISNDEDKSMDDAQSVAFAEREARITADEARLATEKADLVAREAAIIASEKLAVHQGNVAFAEAQVDKGLLAPAGKELVIGLLDTLMPIASVSFGEAAGELAPADAFRRLFDSAAPVVAFGEHAPADKALNDAEERPEELADKAIAFQESERAAGRTISVQAAVRHVQRGEKG